MIVSFRPGWHSRSRRRFGRLPMISLKNSRTYRVGRGLFFSGSRQRGKQPPAATYIARGPVFIEVS